MRMWGFCLIVAVLVCGVGMGHCNDVEAPMLSFQHLEGLPDHLERQVATKHLEREMTKFNLHEIKMRGFLYHDGNQDRWILASEPNLKTCCVGTHGKIGQQIIVEGDFRDISGTGAVTIQGYLLIDPRWDQEGKLVQLYRLEDASVLPEGWPVNTFVLSGIGLGSVLFAWVLGRKKDEIKL